MKKLTTASLSLFFCFQLAIAQKNAKINPDRIIIEGQVPPGYTSDVIALSSSPAWIVRVGYSSEEDRTDNLKILNGHLRWEKATINPVEVWGPLMTGGPLLKSRSLLGTTLEPGDSVFISYKDNNIFFSGKGAEKIELELKLEHINDSLKNLPVCENCYPHEYKVSSLKDYLHWNELMNKKLGLMIPLIESYKSKLTTFAYNCIKDNVLTKIEVARMEKFAFLVGKTDADKKTNGRGEIVNEFGLSNKDLSEIYDSTMNGPAARWLQFERPSVNDPYYLYARLFTDAQRQKEIFFKVNDSISGLPGNKEDRFKLVYSIAKKKYRGVVREACLSFIFWYIRGAIYQCGFSSGIETILADYYAQSQHAKYSEHTKKYELNMRERYNRVFAADFVLTNTKGQSFKKEKLAGKLAVLDFWFTGCTGCVQMAPALHKVEEYFKNDTNVVFLSISIDKNKEQWLKSIAQKKYTSGTGMQLYTGGSGSDHEMIKKYGVTGYPTVYLIDPFDRVLWADKVPDARKNNGKGLIELIEEQLAFIKDGPYVFYGNNNATVYNIISKTVSKKEINTKNAPLLTVTTDMNTEFNIALQKELTPEPVEFARPEKMLVLSDIEGNFEVFRKLLQSNRVIDEKFNWTFGNGHLVFAGDMFDRGMQVTECLWLIYSLEEKAKSAGGYVHFILGNHEIMNLQGDNNYVQKKYKDNAVMLGKTIAQLYTENSELGRWLRTKNVIEKIGDHLFLHGGVSAELNRVPVTIAEINQMARPYYAEYKKDYGSKSLNIIMSDRVGPFWYRGYYKAGAPVSESVVDSTLQKFSVKRIITGHTIVDEVISVHYNGKVINTDTQHAEGKSEALLIEGDKYYRVNTIGERKKLILYPDKSADYTTVK